jgi:hypothetical protein
MCAIKNREILQVNLEDGVHDRDKNNSRQSDTKSFAWRD